MSSHLCADQRGVQFMLDSCPYCNRSYWLNATLPTLISVQLCLSLSEGTHLPCKPCISNVCAMFVHSACSMGVCSRNEWTHTAFTVENSLRTRSTKPIRLQHLMFYSSAAWMQRAHSSGTQLLSSPGMPLQGLTSAYDATLRVPWLA